jgi:hypothetical protein
MVTSLAGWIPAIDKNNGSSVLTAAQMLVKGS